MALQATVARLTHYSVSFLITQDGQAGNTIVITNNDMLAPLVAQGLGGPLVQLLQTNFNPNSQAIQRARLLGDASGLAPPAQDLSNTPHCEVAVLARTLVDGWIVDADTDAVATARGELNVTGPAGASTALVTLTFRHTYDR